MDDFLMRLATEEDTEDVLSLMQACFGDREFLNKAWYKWFYFGCPTGFTRNYIAIDEAARKVVGAYGWLPIRIKVNAQVVNGSLAINAMTHPDYQGKGLFTQMGRYCLSCEEAFRSRISLGVPNHQAYPGHVKVGWKVYSDLSFIAKYSFLGKPCKSKEVPVVDARVDQLIQHVAGRANFMVLKDHRFLNWRYQQRPDQKYRLFVLENKGNIDGYMILKYFSEDGYKKTHILDIMAYSEEAFNDLVLAAEQCSSGRHELNCWQVRHSIHEELFTNNGFVVTEKKNILIIHANYGQDIELKPENWWFALGDNDVY